MTIIVDKWTKKQKKIRPHSNCNYNEEQHQMNIPLVTTPRPLHNPPAKQPSNRAYFACSPQSKQKTWYIRRKRVWRKEIDSDILVYIGMKDRQRIRYWQWHERHSHRLERVMVVVVKILFCFFYIHFDVVIMFIFSSLCKVKPGS